MGWGQSRSGTLADRLAARGVGPDYEPVTGAAPMLDEVLDLTDPHTACDRRIAKLEDDNRQLRCDLARALDALGSEATG